MVYNKDTNAYSGCIKSHLSLFGGFVVETHKFKDILLCIAGRDGFYPDYAFLHLGGKTVIG